MNESVIIIIITGARARALLSVPNVVKANFRDASGSGIVSGGGSSYPPGEAFIKSGALSQSDGERYGKNRGLAVKVSRYLFAPTPTEPCG